MIFPIFLHTPLLLNNFVNINFPQKILRAACYSCQYLSNHKGDFLNSSYYENWVIMTCRRWKWSKKHKMGKKGGCWLQQCRFPSISPDACLLVLILVKHPIISCTFMLTTDKSNHLDKYMGIESGIVTKPSHASKKRSKAIQNKSLCYLIDIVVLSYYCIQLCKNEKYWKRYLKATECRKNHGFAPVATSISLRVDLFTY